MLAPWDVTRLKPSHDPDWDTPEELGREIEADSTVPLAASHPAADLRAFRNRRMLLFPRRDDSGANCFLPAHVNAATIPRPKFAFAGILIRHSVHAEHATDRCDRSAAQYCNGTLVSSQHSYARRAPIRDRIWRIRFRHAPGADFRRGDCVDVWRNDSASGKLRVRGGNRTARASRRVHGPLHHVIQYRVFARAISRRGTPTALGTARAVGRDVRLRMHFHDHDEQDRRAESETCRNYIWLRQHSRALQKFGTYRSEPRNSCATTRTCTAHALQFSPPQPSGGGVGTGTVSTALKYSAAFGLRPARY